MKTTIDERNKIILENEWVINTIMKPYYHLNGIDLDDMRQQARLYMFDGIETYDKGKNTKISTHLYSWARAGALAYLYENRNVHIPWNRINDQIKVNKEVSRYNKNRYVENEVSLDRFNENSASKGETTHGRGDRLQKQVLDSITADPINIYGDFELREHVEYVINKDGLLSNIERFTIIHRMGLMGEEPKTQEAIASLTSNDSVKEFLGRKYTTMGINKAERRAKEKLRVDSDMQDSLA